MSVLEAVRSAGILSDVASDGTRRLRRGIGSVVVSARAHCLRQLDVDHSRLDDRSPVGIVNLDDPVEARHLDRHRPLAGLASEGNCAGAQSGARTARAESNTIRGEQPYQTGDVVGSPWKDDSQRPRLVGRHGIAFIDQWTSASSDATASFPTIPRISATISSSLRSAAVGITLSGRDSEMKELTTRVNSESYGSSIGVKPLFCRLVISCYNIPNQNHGPGDP